MDSTDLRYLVSSANINKCMGVIDTCRNIVNINKNSKGPNMLPCGTPEITGNGGEITPSNNLTKWFLPFKYDLNQSSKFPEILSNSTLKRSSE